MLKILGERRGLILRGGLSNEEVLRKRERHGTNRLAEGKKEGLLMKFLKQFNDFMVLVLIFAAVVSSAISFFEGTGEYVDSIIIVFIIVLNAVFGLVQESKAEKSLEALKKMSSPTAKVKRDGQILTIPREELVPGDYIFIETGGYVPADSRLVQSYNLKVEESALTGETLPINKDAGAILEGTYPPVSMNM